MTRHKWKDEVIDRNYPIRCKKCKSLTYITDEDYECQVCGAVMCPDCLTLITDENSTYSKWSTSMGAGQRVTCLTCRYDVVDEDLPFGI